MICLTAPANILFGHGGKPLPNRPLGMRKAAGSNPAQSTIEPNMEVSSIPEIPCLRLVSAGPP